MQQNLSIGPFQTFNEITGFPESVLICIVVSLFKNIETSFWPPVLYLDVFFFSEMETRKAYEHFSSLKDLTKCVCFLRLAYFQMAVTE